MEKRFLSPFRDIFAATSSVIGNNSGRLHEPTKTGQLRCGSPSSENLESICAKAGDPFSTTSTVNPSQSLISSIVILSSFFKFSLQCQSSRPASALEI